MRSAMSRWLPLAVLIVGMIGCDHRPSGKYAVEAGGMQVEFKSGKAILSMGSAGAPQSETDDYTVNGSTITVKSSSGDIPFTIMQDGSLQTAGGTFKKVAD